MSKKNKHGSQFPKPNSPSTPAVTPAPVATVPNPRQPKNEAMLFDPRTKGTPVYERLSELRTRTNDPAKLRKQQSHTPLFALTNSLRNRLHLLPLPSKF